MTIRPGAVVVNCGSRLDWNAVRICDGANVSLAAPVDDGGMCYEANAIIPHLPWRETSQSEQSVLCASNNSAPIAKVVRWKFNDNILAPLAGLRLHEITSQEEANETMAGLRYKTAVASFIDRLKPWTNNPESVRILGVSVKNPKLITVTADPTKGLRLGLHLDSWDKLPLAQRTSARYCININLGLESRFFTFCNLPVPHMHELMGMPRNVVGTQIGREFFASNRNYPIVRLELAPHIAYIAPTDLLIHDATTLDKKYPDISIAVLGHFKLEALIEQSAL